MPPRGKVENPSNPKNQMLPEHRNEHQPSEMKPRQVFFNGHTTNESAVRVSVPFPYHEIDGEEGIGGGEQDGGEVMRALHVFIRDRVVARRGGRLPSARAIAVRLVVLEYLLDSTSSQSLAQIARELGCSRAWLSKVALEFSESIGMHASWQRLAARSKYRERALAVHAGRHTCSAKWERDRRSGRTRSAKSESVTTR